MARFEPGRRSSAFERVDSPWGRMEAWRANAMAMGALAALMDRIRNDSAAKPDTIAPAVLSSSRPMLAAAPQAGRGLCSCPRYRQNLVRGGSEHPS